MADKLSMSSRKVIVSSPRSLCCSNISQYSDIGLSEGHNHNKFKKSDYSGEDFGCRSSRYTRDVFRSLDPGEKHLLDSMTGRSLSLPPNRMLLNEGEVGVYLYRIVTGWAYRYRVTANNSRQILDFLMPGEIIGLQGSLFGVLLHSVRSLTPLRVNAIDGGILGEAIRNQPGLTVRLVRHFAAESKRADDLLTAMGCYDAVGRLSFLMLHLYSRQAERGNVDALGCQFPLRRQHMADTLGLTGAHINRTLNFLRNERIAFVENERLSIVDLPRLHEFAHGMRSTLSMSHLANKTRRL